jgi:antirestriction protein
MNTNLELSAITQLDEAETYFNEYRIPARAILAYWGNLSLDWDKIAYWIDDAVEAYIGEAEGFNANKWLAEHLESEGILDLSGIPQELQYYFDYEAYGRDLELGGDVWESDGFYFWNR